VEGCEVEEGSGMTTYGLVAFIADMVNLVLDGVQPLGSCS
jgi:hypothetical protein